MTAAAQSPSLAAVVMSPWIHACSHHIQLDTGICIHACRSTGAKDCWIAAAVQLACQVYSSHSALLDALFDMVGTALAHLAAPEDDAAAGSCCSHECKTRLVSVHGCITGSASMNHMPEKLAESGVPGVDVVARFAGRHHYASKLLHVCWAGLSGGEQL